MHHLRILAVTLASVCGTGAIGQAITTIGSGPAEACYDAARDHRAAQADLAHCDQALHGTLSLADLTATYVNRGILHAVREDYDNAIRDYDRAIQLDPSEAEAYLNKGLLLLRVENREREALDLVSSAIAKKTRKPALAYFARAVAHEGLGQPGAAYRDYQEAAARDPIWALPVRELRRFKKKG